MKTIMKTNNSTITYPPYYKTDEQIKETKIYQAESWHDWFAIIAWTDVHK